MLILLLPVTSIRCSRGASKLVTRTCLRFQSTLDKKLLVLTDQFASLQQQYSPTKHPIVLCHGFSGFDSLVLFSRPKFLRLYRAKKAIKRGMLKIDYWAGIEDTLSNIGCEVYVGKVPPFGAISERAKSLNEFLDHNFHQVRKDDTNSHVEPIKVNIIAHSMGGLDSRYLISKLHNSNYKVVSLTTISTPHHGSEVADFIMDTVNPKLIFSQAIPQLTTDYLKEFNEEVPDKEDVAYFSYGARFTPRWFNAFRTPWNIMRHRIDRDNNRNKEYKSLDNDGLVSVESAKWGKYLGTLDQVDHLDLINWTNRLRTFIDLYLFNHKPTFNALAFYSHIVNSLSKRGF